MAKPTPLEQLQAQADVPESRLGKALTVLPVVMTVIATLLAGLASGEMTKAQYERAYAAQLQSKAGDQWAFFQAKRLRGEMQRNTLDVLSAQSASAAGPSAPSPPPAPKYAPAVVAALNAARDDAAPAVMNPLLLALPPEALPDALQTAKGHAAAYDKITSPLLAPLLATGAPAARQKNLLWGLAAGAGMLAVVFAVYVYLYV